MSPEKLFAYLDGRLPAAERAEIEQRLESDPQLQREMTIAREIHLRARGDAREAIFQDEAAMADRGRKMALRVGAAFVALITINVIVGVVFIARHEASNPNRQLIEKQMRDQITKSLAQAGAATLTPPPLDVSDITVPVAKGQLGPMADQIVALAVRLGGSATKELPDKGHVGVLVDLPSNREPEFRAAIATLSGAVPPPPSPNQTTAAPAEKKSFVVQIVEPATP